MDIDRLLQAPQVLKTETNDSLSTVPENRTMSHAPDIREFPPEALALLDDPRTEGMKFTTERRPLKPADPPARGESPFLLFSPSFEEASTARVTWVNEPQGALACGNGRGFPRITERPRFEEARKRPKLLSDAWTYAGWVIASPRFAEIVRSLDSGAIETVEIDWIFSDGKMLDGYVFLDVRRLLRAYDYTRSVVIVDLDTDGRKYIGGLGMSRALRKDLATEGVHIFRDAIHESHLFVSRVLARQLLAAGVRQVDFLDPADMQPVAQ